MMAATLASLATGLGILEILESDAGLLAIGLPGTARTTMHRLARGEAVVAAEQPSPAVRTQLAEYCAGTRRTFALPLLPRGTEFQMLVWQALLAIPYGATCTYADVARAIGRPQSTRAVGAAIGQNPLPIVIPCHRVIGKDGSLVGFGGGLPLKRKLLDLERPTAPS